VKESSHLFITLPLFSSLCSHPFAHPRWSLVYAILVSPVFPTALVPLFPLAMASMGSAPFLVEANADFTLMMMRNLKLSSPKFGSVSGSSFGHSGARGRGRGRVNHLCSRGLLCLVENNKRIRASGMGFGMSEESEKMVQGTIEKSKQVLAMQKELLEKVSFVLWNGCVL